MANESRFTGKAEIYATYRPSYPSEVIDLIVDYAKLRYTNIEQCVIADIGAGTGKFTTLLLERGFQVIAVEPNEDMLKQLHRLKLDYPQTLTIQAASAELTGLAAQSVDMIVCAQAFHWFDEVKAKHDWQSILREDGYVFLVWNQRDNEGSPFMQEYEQLLLSLDGTSTKQGEKYKSYKDVGHRYMSVERLSTFFGQKPQLYQLAYEQRLDEQGLIGRILSSSYTLRPEDSGYDEFVEQIKILFHRHEQDGFVSIRYKTDCYYGKIN